MEDSTRFKVYNDLNLNRSLEGIDLDGTVSIHGNPNAEPASGKSGAEPTARNTDEGGGLVPRRDRNIGVLSELRHVVELPIPGGLGQTHLISREKFEAGEVSKEDDFKKAAILVKTEYNEDFSELVKYQLEIQSPTLKTYLRTVGRSHRSINVDADIIVIPEPFLPLFHLRDLMLEETEKDSDEVLKKEIRLLLEFIESKEGLEDTIAKYNDLVPTGKISFDILWTIFPPNILVYHHEGEVEQCFLVESAELHLSLPNQQYTAVFSLISGGHDGKRFGLYRRKMLLPLFSGIVDISPHCLPIVPLEYLDSKERDEIQDRLIARGRKYLRLQQRKWSYRECVGDFKYQEMTEESKLRLRDDKMRIETNRRVVIDANAAADMVSVGGPTPSYQWLPIDHAISPCYDEYIKSFSVARKPTTTKSSPLRTRRRIMKKLGRHDSSSSDDSDSDIRGAWRDQIFADILTLPTQANGEDPASSHLSNFDYLMCPYYIDAFLLDRKMWIWAPVSGIKHIRWRPDPWEDLRLNSSKKDMVINLVRSFNTTDEPFEGFDDVIQGKGKGIIFLLHGEPGLGKTMTAELVAEQTHRPLYQLTMGDLGTDARSVENSLLKVFKLGWRWGAVVLLDEADVLLAERSNDLERSRIVAVFLRLIEYYRGLLFLTTNRPGDIDDAFKNRIHVSILYSMPDAEARVSIWKNLLTRKREKMSLDKSWTESEFQTLGDLEVNGRDIRNLIRIAYGYAKSKKTDLGVRHVRLVIKHTSNAKNAVDIVERLDLAAHRARTMSQGEKKDYVDSTESEYELIGDEEVGEPEASQRNIEGESKPGDGHRPQTNRKRQAVQFVQGDVTQSSSE